MGRWINRDPIGKIGSINQYLFVFNKPILNIDKLGLFPLCINGDLRFVNPHYVPPGDDTPWEYESFQPDPKTLQQEGGEGGGVMMFTGIICKYKRIVKKEYDIEVCSCFHWAPTPETIILRETEEKSTKLDLYTHGGDFFIGDPSDYANAASLCKSTAP